MTAHSKNLSGVKYILSHAIRKQNSSQELDAIFLICGEEGSGKSNTILSIIDLWEQITGKRVEISNIGTNLRELLTTLSKGSRGIHALDEGEELSNLNQFDRIVKLTKQCFVVSRANAQIVLLSYPNPLKINPYFKEDRAKGIFFCYKQKYIFYFTRTKFRMIREKIAKNTNVKSINDFVSKYKHYATLIDTCPLYTGHLKKEYLERKKQNITRVFNEALSELSADEKTYSLTKACKLLGVSKQTINEALTKGVVVVKWNATHTKMKLNDMDIALLKDYLNPDKTENPKTTPHTNIDLIPETEN